MWTMVLCISARRAGEGEQVVNEFARSGRKLQQYYFD